MTVYLITCLANGKYYVGQTVRKNLSSYLREKRRHAFRPGKQSHIYAALRKYPLDEFIIERLTMCSTKEELDRAERLWICALNSREDSIGMNISAGGDASWFGLRHSPASIEKMKTHPNRSRGFATDEQRREHSEKMKGAGNPMFGKKRTFSPRWRERVVAANRKPRLLKKVERTLEEMARATERRRIRDRKRVARVRAEDRASYNEYMRGYRQRNLERIRADDRERYHAKQNEEQAKAA